MKTKREPSPLTPAEIRHISAVANEAKREFAGEAPRRRKAQAMRGRKKFSHRKGLDPNKTWVENLRLASLGAIVEDKPTLEAYELAAAWPCLLPERRVQRLLATVGVPFEGHRKPEHYRHCARDDATAAEWAFHNAILGVKKQVVAQYGEDSNEMQSLGLTKKSEIVRPGRKAAPAPAKP